MVLDDYESDYETLLWKAIMLTLQIVRIKTLATEIFKTFHSLNPIYMNEIFQTNPLITRNLRSKNNLVTHRYNSAIYGKNSPRINTWTRVREGGEVTHYFCIRDLKIHDAVMKRRRSFTKFLFK